MYQQAFDHIFHTLDVSVKNISVINNYLSAMELSDHFGIVVEI